MLLLEVTTDCKGIREFSDENIQGPTSCQLKYTEKTKKAYNNR